MSSSQGISNKASNYRYSYQSTRDVSTESATQTVTVSDDNSVQGAQRGKVAGVGADQRASLGQYKTLLNGNQLPTMTQLMSGEVNGSRVGAEESVARRALDRPELPLGDASATDKVGAVSLEDQSATGAVGADQSQTQPGGVESKSGRGERGEVLSSEEGKEDKKSERSGESGESKKSATGEELTREESEQVDKLKARDREVRTHEQAHVAAGGQYVRGGISYDYQRGPDGRNYAVGGHVNIDVSEARTPEATIVKMQQVKRAALAPAEPSGADRAVAATAGQKEQQARSELLEEQQNEVQERRAETAERPQSEGEGSSVSTSEKGAETSTASAVAPDAAVSSTASPASASSSPQVEAPEPPKVRDQMNLAREARMRIKRGITWRA